MKKQNLIMPFYTLEEVAKITEKSTRTIFRMLTDGRITGEKDASGKYIFKRETIETYLAAQAGDKIAQIKQSLPELKKYCEETRANNCQGCPFRSSDGCTIRSTPDKWSL